MSETYLTPAEILNLLGFRVPDEGVFVGSFDKPLLEGALRLLGETISIESIPDQKIHALQRTIAAFVQTVDPAMGGVAAQVEATPDTAAKTRWLIAALLGQTFNFCKAA